MALKRLWLGLAGYLGLVIVGLGLYIARSAERSTSLLILGGVVGLFFAAAIVFAAFVTHERLEALRRRMPPATLFGAAGILVLGSWGLLTRPEWIYACIGLGLAAIFALGFWSLYPTDKPLQRNAVLIAGLALVALIVTAIRILALAAYPALQLTDEGWLLGWAVSYLKTGTFSDWIMPYGGHDVQRFYFPMALWLKVVGMGYFEARLFSFLLIFPLIFFSYRAARRLFDARTAVLTAIVLFCSAVVLIGARIRHDVGLGLSIALSLWLYAEATHRAKQVQDRLTLLLHCGAGMAIGLGWFSHYHATFFGAAFAVGLYGPRYIAGLRRGKWRPEAGFVAYLLGGLLGAGIVFVFQIIPDWQAFIGTRDLRAPQALADYLPTFFAHILSIADHSQFEFLLIALATAAALVRRKAEDVSLLLTLLLAHLSLMVMEAVAWNYYPMPLTPLYAMLVAAMFTRGISRAPEAVPKASKPMSRAVAFTFAVFIVCNLMMTVRLPLDYVRLRGPLRPTDPPVITWFKQNADPAKSVIVADNVYFLWLYDYRFVSPMAPDYMTPANKARFKNRDEVWDDLKPDYFLLDYNLSTSGLLQELEARNYYQTRGYKEVARFGGTKTPVIILQKK